MRGLCCERHAHSHLITLLATFEHNSHYFLVMPFAEADLLGYWKDPKHDRPGDSGTALWLAEQCQGLAEALNKIHRWETFSATGLLHPDSIPTVNSIPNSKGTLPSIQQTISGSEAPIRKLFGRHGDIKPENILWFSDGGGRGSLKITDFGIAHFSTKDAVPAVTRGPVGMSPSYRAPECDLPDWMLSPAADIWSLGCVFLEFATWFFGGWQSVLRFGSDRKTPDPAYPATAPFQSDKFYTIEGYGTEHLRATVKQAVVEVSMFHSCPILIDRFCYSFPCYPPNYLNLHPTNSSVSEANHFFKPENQRSPLRTRLL
jgi:serine/threonine protein kinase